MSPRASQVFFKPVIEDLSMELARKCTELISDIHYKEEYKKSKDKCTFVTDTPMLKHVKHIGAFISEAKYKGTIKADLSNSLYKQMPATIDSVFAREVTQLQNIKYGVKSWKRLMRVLSAVAGGITDNDKDLP
eukprot:bmy_04369T0